MRTQHFNLLLVGIVVGAMSGLVGCGNERETNVPDEPLFIWMPAAEVGISFVNVIEETEEVNIHTFEYIYNGGGVAVGDVNNDSLPDLFFTATVGPNGLYLNKGNFEFVDVTELTGTIGRSRSMTTGATMVDINDDGNLDIYVCQTGKPGWASDTHNLLYVNNGDGSFTESANEYGIDSDAYSNQASFFDYDGDGDLDLYLLNHPVDFETADIVRPVPFEAEDGVSDQLFRNNGNGTFSDVSARAGIRNYAYGLSVTVFDYNNDGWPDLYVANDYVVPDFLYVNNGDGTFEERGQEAFGHTPHFGMGSAAGDINNDGMLDVVSLDMRAEDARRQRMLGSIMMYDRYQLEQQYGYGRQVARNVLQLNNGDETFSDIAYLSGMAETDWSWSPLLADFDNDSYIDLYITNGYRHDVTNVDYSKFTLDSLRMVALQTGEVLPIDEFLAFAPSERISNYAYRNRGDLTFENVTSSWGLWRPSFSNGAAYADLDNDGDLDLIVNEIDGPPSIYRNQSEMLFPDRHWLSIKFEGPSGNRAGIGARAYVSTESGRQVRENIPTRGFFSSVERRVHFGLGSSRTADITIRWPDGRTQLLSGVVGDQVLTVRYAEASDSESGEVLASDVIFAYSADTGIEFEHVEDPFIDFKRDPLIPHMHSREGPFIAQGDVNGDNLPDLYVSGAAGQSGRLFVQRANGSFNEREGPWSGADALREDTHALFFDADGDGAIDLYVGSGGSHLTAQQEGAAQAYQDRLYLGDGAGGFEKSPAGTLPQMPMPTGAVAAGDIDSDGDIDLFVGGRLVPGRWPEAPRSFILLNNDGRFVDATSEVAPLLSEVGLVSGAELVDVDGDGVLELVLVGEWMAPQVWSANSSGVFERESGDGLAQYTGWWNSLTAADLDGDGDTDLIAGNLGLNSRIRGSIEQPVRVYARDFDSNGSLDPILTLYYPDGGEYPIHRREAITQQLPYLQQRFPRFTRYSSSTVNRVFPGTELEGALVLEAGWFASTWFENDGAGRFTAHMLPLEAQVAPVYALVVTDVDGDGRVDVLLAGNSRAADVESGPYDAGRGLLLRGATNSSGFTVVPGRQSGLSLRGDVRSLQWLATTNGPLLVVGNNDGPVQVLAVNK